MSGPVDEATLILVRRHGSEYEWRAYSGPLVVGRGRGFATRGAAYDAGARCIHEAERLPSAMRAVLEQNPRYHPRPFWSSPAVSFAAVVLLATVIVSVLAHVVTR